MLSTLALAFGAPAAALLLTRSRTVRRAAADIRGIALQTVIIIVVMLLIAGGVSAVLLSRGSDVMSELENAQVTSGASDSFTGCQAIGRSLLQMPDLAAVTGAAAGAAGTITFNAAGPACFVVGAGGVFSAQACMNRGGAHSGTTTEICTFN